jgi:TRAP-type mannitol/chloroaromatic compound transport system permease small subunit
VNSGYSRFIDALGKSVSWLTALMAVTTFTVVVLRYAFDLGSIVLQESVIYMHGIVFLLGIPYTLQTDGHVRVDILRGRWGVAGRARVEIAGHVLFLIPVSATILVSSLTYVAASWRVLEGSPEVGGIPGIFVLKSLIPVMAGLLLLLALGQIAGHVHTLRRGLRNHPRID